jgi:hypothetical protein
VEEGGKRGGKTWRMWPPSQCGLLPAVAGTPTNVLQPPATTYLCHQCMQAAADKRPQHSTRLVQVVCSCSRSLQLQTNCTNNGTQTQKAHATSPLPPVHAVVHTGRSAPETTALTLLANPTPQLPQLPLQAQPIKHVQHGQTSPPLTSATSALSRPHMMQLTRLVR